MGTKLSRRTFLHTALVTSGAAVLAACAPKATPAPTAAPAKAAAQPTQAPAKQEATKAPAQATSAPAQPAAKGAVTVRFMCRGDAQGDAQREFSKRWNEKNPNVQIKAEDTAWDDLAKKTETLAAAGTVADIVFQVIWWFPYLANKNVWLSLDDLVAAKDPGMSDFYPWAIDICKWGGKLRALPEAVHPGKCIVVYNEDMFKAKSIPLPTLEWTWNDWGEAAKKLNDKTAGVFGVMGTYGHPETDSVNLRTFGGNIFDFEGKKMMLDKPESITGIKAHRDWVADLGIGPKPGEAQGTNLQMFAGGKLATTQNNVDVVGLKAQIADKFKWGVTILPKAPTTGKRGTITFANQIVIYSKSKVPQEAYDFVSYLTGPEAATWLTMKNGKQPFGRKSAWANPDVLKEWPHFGWLDKELLSKNLDPFPMPANTRFNEFADLYQNEMTGIYAGTKNLEKDLADIVAKCQKVLDQPM